MAQWEADHEKQLIAGLILLVASRGLLVGRWRWKGKGSPYDYRIKSVVYNPVDAGVWIPLPVLPPIVVAPDESYVTHAFGDSNSYAFTHVENNMFIAERVLPAILTLFWSVNKRTYNIVLRTGVGDYTTKDAQ